MEKKQIEVQVHVQTSSLVKVMVDEDLTNEEIIELVKKDKRPANPPGTDFIIALIQEGITKKEPTTYYTVTRPDKPLTITKSKPSPPRRTKIEELKEDLLKLGDRDLMSLFQDLLKYKKDTPQV